jgi:hypothetical protein
MHSSARAGHLAGIYQFQIRALGVLGYTDWMDTKTFVVA